MPAGSSAAGAMHPSRALSAARRSPRTAPEPARCPALTTAPGRVRSCATGNAAPRLVQHRFSCPPVVRLPVLCTKSRLAATRSKLTICPPRRRPPPFQVFPRGAAAAVQPAADQGVRPRSGRAAGSPSLHTGGRPGVANRAACIRYGHWARSRRGPGRSG